MRWCWSTPMARSSTPTPSPWRPSRPRVRLWWAGAARSAAAVRLAADPRVHAAARDDRPARADQADQDDRAADRRQRVPGRGHQREPGERPAGLRQLRSHPDELLMLVVRDLSGTVDTEAELARSQRQTEMILRAAAEGVVGTDTEGGSSSSIRRPPRYWDIGPVISAGRTCTPSSFTRARTASPSRTRSPRSPTPCAPGASTGCAGRCCGPSPGTRCRST